MIVFERRASAILFNLLRARRDPRPFLIPANACPIVLQTFDAASQPFRLVDIEEPGLTMSIPSEDEDIGGIVFIRTYGTEGDPTSFFASLRERFTDALIVDDKCLCRPDCDGAALSPLADVTLFSTGYAKYVDIGRGGFAHLRDDVFYARANNGPSWLDLRAPDEQWSDYASRVTTETLRMDAHKRTLNAIYESGIPTDVQLPRALQQWRFNIRMPDADGLVASIFEAGLFASRHYAAPADFRVAAKLHAEVVNLFNDRYFDAERAERVTALVQAHLRRMQRAE